jgi:gamma-carbonic anhydrase
MRSINSPSEPLVLPYETTQPYFASEPHFVGDGPSVLGRVTIGSRAVLGHRAVIRGDGHFIRIGDDFFLGDISTVHIAHEIYPATVGHRVAVGRNAVVHACIVGDDCLIEDDVVILDGSNIESRVLIQAGSTVFPRSVLSANSVYAGSPAKLLRTLTATEYAECNTRIRRTKTDSPDALQGERQPLELKAPADAFIARSAYCRGRISLGTQTSIFFGCELDALQSSIAIGAYTNVQDNSRIDCSDGEVLIGRCTTIGHNVRMRSCRIGDRALVGIGSVISPQTTIEDDVLLAAGATTDVGQILETGWVWGGRPARQLSRLSESKREMMSEIIRHYCVYGVAYIRAQHQMAMPEK